MRAPLVTTAACRLAAVLTAALLVGQGCTLAIPVALSASSGHDRSVPTRAREADATHRACVERRDSLYREAMATDDIVARHRLIEAMPRCSSESPEAVVSRRDNSRVIVGGMVVGALLDVLAYVATKDSIEEGLQ